MRSQRGAQSGSPGRTAHPPSHTSLPSGSAFEGAPFWGWLAGGGTRPKVGKQCLGPVSLVMLRSRSDPCVGTSPPSFSFTLHEAGQWTQGHALVTQPEVSFLTKAKAFHLQDGLTTSSSPEPCRKRWILHTSLKDSEVPSPC